MDVSYASARRGDSLFSLLNLGSFWLKDESLEDSANLPDPDIIAAEIVEDLEAALGLDSKPWAELVELSRPTRKSRQCDELTRLRFFGVASL